jgi:hypothetical protein
MQSCTSLNIRTSLKTNSKINEKSASTLESSDGGSNPLRPSKIKHITRDEWFSGKTHPPLKSLVKCLVDLMDRNKDGTVSKKEFLYRYPVNRKPFMVSQTDHQCLGTVLGIGIEHSSIGYHMWYRSGLFSHRQPDWHMSVYISIRQQTSADVNRCQHTSAYWNRSLRQKDERPTKSYNFFRKCRWNYSHVVYSHSVFVHEIKTLMSSIIIVISLMSSLIIPRK